MKFKNPANGYVEEVADPGLWIFLFGTLYLAVCGIWTHFILSLMIIVLSVVYLGEPGVLFAVIFWFIYACFAPAIIKSHYLRKGWIEVTGTQTTGKALAPKERKCPFCAELVKHEAVVCRYCGRELPVPSLQAQPGDQILRFPGHKASHSHDESPRIPRLRNE